MSACRTFSEKVVVITGAAGGIGRALAHRFGRGGAKLALMDLKAQGLEEAQGALEEDISGVEVLALPGDVTDEAQCKAAIAVIEKEWGGVDALINNAGAVHRSGFLETSTAVIEKVMAVNFHGSLYTTKAALPSLVERSGLVIIIASVAGLVPLYGRSGYVASKHALHGLFESARAEFRDHGVGLLMVYPGFTRSGFERAAMGADGKPAGSSRSMVGKLAEPEDVADAIFRGAEQGKRALVMSPVGKFSAILSRVAPGLYERMMVKRLKSELEQ